MCSTKDGSAILNGAASSLTDAGLLPSRSSTRRRVGSDKARNTPSIGFALAAVMAGTGGSSSSFGRDLSADLYLGQYLSISTTNDTCQEFDRTQRLTMSIMAGA